MKPPLSHTAYDAPFHLALIGLQKRMWTKSPQILANAVFEHYSTSIWNNTLDITNYKTCHTNSYSFETLHAQRNLADSLRCLIK